ncbi:hypothetical protein [Mesonia aestuariivivens]|uniref:DUF2442 domain-containing protein n=1 Tax=Mesonia aestuariivivens TaxID=2796128 RepID=A0ABS6W563_9FLAO|nr:hypothetical protein [Mesonia aestuariivivens]MBW2962990.1 hypothetical protein [Mesonia aestuariivivens]
MAISLEQVIILCIDEEVGIKIEVKFKSINESKLAMYYVDVEGKMKGQKEIPWEDFDKNSPLAIVNFTSPNNFELDWKGFTKNGELAIDYALLGKKNLEGNYKRK